MRRRQVLVTLLTALPAGCLRLSEANAGSGGQTGSKTSASDPAADGGFEIRYADENGTLRPLIDQSDVVDAGAPQRAENGGAYRVNVALTEEAARRFVTTMDDVGAFERPQEHPIFTYFDGREVHSFVLSRDLIQSMQRGEFQKDPRFVITVTDEATARNLSRSLRD
ncbi:MAG: hypothetical protein ABEJ70_06885 [Halobacteriaceae archaeon]